MADVVRTVGAAGDETTIAAALTWMKNSANYQQGVDDIGIIRLIDDAVYSESNLDFSGFAGTPSITSHVRLEAASDVWCNGSHSGARIEGSTNGQHVITVGGDFVHIKGVAVKQTSTGSSDECIRNTGADSVLLEKLYLETNNTASQDCIYAATVAFTNFAIFDCVVKCGGASARIGIHAQQTATGNVQTWHIEHCTVDADGADGCIGGQARSNEVTMNCYNNACFDATRDFEEEHGTAGRDIVFAGAGNISSDNTALDNFIGSVGIDDAVLVDADVAGKNFRVGSLTGKDYSLRRSVTGTDIADKRFESGATRDSRIDDTVDVAGRPRPASDADRSIGAFQILYPAGAFPTEFRYDETIRVTGSDFGATQSTGTVYLSDTNTVGTGTDVDLTAGITSWADHEIVIDLSLVTLTSLGPGTRYVIVDPASGSDQPFTVTAHRSLAFQMKQSSNLTPFGEATTAQLTAPASKTTADFDGGFAQGDINPGETFDVGLADYREDEWCIEATADAVAGETYDFRVLLADAALDTYSVTPQFTISSVAVSSDPWHKIEQGMVTTYGAGMGGVLVE